MFQEIRANSPSKNGGAAPPFLKNGGALHPCTPANSPSEICSSTFEVYFALFKNFLE